MKFISHKFHVRQGVTEKSLITLTQVIQSGFSGCSCGYPVFWAFTVTEFEHVTLPALGGQFITFIRSELKLTLLKHHFKNSLCTNVSQFIPGKNIVIAGIEVTVEFQGSCMSAGFGENAHSRLSSHCIGQRRVKKLYIPGSYIIAHPFIKYFDIKLAEFHRIDRP